MKNNELRSPLLRAFGLVVTLIGVAPALVFFRVPTAEGLRTLIPLALCLMCLPISAMPKNGRIAALIPLCALCGAAAYWITLNDVGASRYIYILISALLPALALPSLLRERIHAELSVGVVATLLAWLLMRSPHIALCKAEVLKLGIAFLPLMLVYVNLAQLEWESSAQRSGQISGMRPANFALTCVIVAASFAVAYAKDIWTLIKKCVAALISLFMRMLAYSPEQEKPAAAAGGGEDMQIPPYVEQEPNIIVKILEITLYVMAIAAILFALIYVARHLPKAIRKLYNWLKNGFKQYIVSISAEDGDYVDISESLQAGDTRLRGGRRRRAKRRYKWDELDNRRRVRAAYRLAVEGKASPNQTARENLLATLRADPDAASSLAVSYDRARYSEHAITDAEAQAARDAARAASSR